MNKDEGILDRSHGLYWPSACTHNARARLEYSRTGAQHPKRCGALFEKFARYPGGMKVRLYLPPWFMRPQMMLLEPLQRALGLPAFLSRDTVDASRGHLISARLA
jgi:hypothetical protein